LCWYINHKSPQLHDQNSQLGEAFVQLSNKTPQLRDRNAQLRNKSPHLHDQSSQLGDAFVQLSNESPQLRDRNAQSPTVQMRDVTEGVGDATERLFQRFLGFRYQKTVIFHCSTVYRQLIRQFSHRSTLSYQ